MTSKPEQRNKVLLFIHGVRNDDRDANWRRTLDEALLREGTESLEARGYQVIAPSYLAQLEGEPVPDIDEPPTTYRKSSDEEYDRAAGRYWAALADLERTGIRGRIQPGLGADLPAGAVAEGLMSKLFADAAEYCANADRRNAIFARLLGGDPAERRPRDCRPQPGLGGCRRSALPAPGRHRVADAHHARLPPDTRAAAQAPRPPPAAIPLRSRRAMDQPVWHR